jgi:cytochrome c553
MRGLATHVEVGFPFNLTLLKLPSSRAFPGNDVHTRRQSMKRIMTITAMLALSTGMLMAQDGPTLFKKCAACHGAGGEGKMGPSIKGKDVTSVLTNGGKKSPHAARFGGLTDDQIATVAAYVKGLK